MVVDHQHRESVVRQRRDRRGCLLDSESGPERAERGETASDGTGTGTVPPPTLFDYGSELRFCLSAGERGPQDVVAALEEPVLVMRAGIRARAPGSDSVPIVDAISPTFASASMRSFSRRTRSAFEPMLS